MHAGSIVWPVDVTSALADLTEISSQIEAAVVFDGTGAVLASTLTGEPETDRLARTGVSLFEEATARFRSTGRSVTQLEAELRRGGIFVVRHDDLGIVARTGARAPSGLVLYDLRACLRTIAETQQRKPKSRSRAAKKAETADA